MTVNTYAVLRSNDITKLAKTKAPSCAILLYPLLLRYCQDKVSSYPGVKTLCRGLGDAYNERTVYRNLAWLVDNGFVKRKHRRSKERWTIVSRLVENTKKAIEKVIDTSEKLVKAVSVEPERKRHNNPDTSRHNKRTKENKSLSNKRKHKRLSPVFAYERWDRPVEPVKTEAEKAWTDLCMLTHPPDLSKASVAQKEAIIRGVLHTKELAWVLGVYPDILVET